MSAPGIPLWDVIAAKPAGIAFGMTFGDAASAEEYSRRLAALGYEIDAFEHGTEISLADALERAARHFADPRITA